MNLEPAPRLPKWIFLAIDAGLLLTAFLIISFAKDPYQPLPFVSAVICVALAAVIGLLPFLVDYAADTAEALEQERQRLSEQAVRLNATIENLARTAAHIKAVEEAAHKSAREAETLPYRMQEKLAEFNEALAAKEDSDRETLETELEALRSTHTDQLKAVAEKIGKAATDWSALEVATRKQLAVTEAALTKLQAGSAEAAARFEAQVSTALKELDDRLAELKQAAASIPTAVTVTTIAAPAAIAPAPAPVPFAAPPPAPEPAAEPLAPSSEILPPEAPASTEPAIAVPTPTPEPTAEPAPLASAESPKPKKPRPPRKAKPEETLAAMSEPAIAPTATTEPAAEPAPEPVALPLETTSEPAPQPVAEPAEAFSLASDDSAESPAASSVESSTSSDGATRLLATAYIGIGNKLFIRGDGPGLSWDHGVPMQFVSIGKWGWSTQEAAGPVRCKLYKNDEVLALTGELVLEAGRHTEVTALF